jgi:methionine-rich copper-binding protein CopC
MLAVALRPTEGRPGEMVRAEVRCTPQAGAVSQVRLRVDSPDADIEWPLHPHGDVWVVEAPVPYDTPPGTYSLSFHAFAPDGRLVASSRVAFEVL